MERDYEDMDTYDHDRAVIHAPTSILEIICDVLMFSVVTFAVLTILWSVEILGN